MKNSFLSTLTAAAPFARACGFALLLFATGLSYGQALPPEESSPGGPRYQADEVLVQFKADVTDQQLTGAFQRGRLGLIKHIQTPAMKAHGRIGITRTATVLSVPETIRLLNQLPGVEFAELNWVLTKAYEANDPFYLDGSLWGMFSDDAPGVIGPATTSNPFGTQAEKAWAAGFVGSPDVFVGIIDGGIQYTHPDLAANIWTNPGEIPGNGIDDDGNGYVDDVHGWSASDNSGNVSNVDDTDVHGTHVAGTIGAVGGNGLGVAGVNWNVTMIPGVLFGRGTATTVDAIEAIDYMTNLKTRKGLNLVALNNSWGGGGFSQALLDSFTRAAQAGILSVAAAGNGATNIDVAPFFYPATYNTTPAASYDAMISVAAIGPAGTLSSFSNYGQNTVDLSAPGGERVDVNNPSLHDPAYEIWSTVPTSGYAYSRGTSMSAPHVTGAIALYASTHPGSSAAQTRYDLLTAGIRPLAALQGLTVTGGTLDIGTLMAVPANGLPAPATPANLQATAVSSTRVDLSWADQSNNELGFAIDRSTDGVTFYLADTVGAADVNYSDLTVQPGSTYFYRVRAYNPGGSSAYAPPTSVTVPLVSLPSAPSSLTATALSAGKGVSLTWKDNSNNEGGFQIERKTGSTWQLLTTVAANTRTFKDASAARRTTYTYRVLAFNVAGGSPYSNQVSVTTK